MSYELVQYSRVYLNFQTKLELPLSHPENKLTFYLASSADSSKAYITSLLAHFLLNC